MHKNRRVGRSRNWIHVLYCCHNVDSTLCIAAVAVIALAGSIFGLTRTNQNEGFSDIQLANIEALADGENPCPQILTIGYRSWSLSGFLRSKKGFRDCCGVYVEAYNPQGTCNI